MFVADEDGYPTGVNNDPTHAQLYKLSPLTLMVSLFLFGTEKE